MIVIVLSFSGKYLEHLAKQHTTSQLAALFHLQARHTDMLLVGPDAVASWYVLRFADVSRGLIIAGICALIGDIVSCV
jgi:hypothetical protein